MLSNQVVECAYHVKQIHKTGLAPRALVAIGLISTFIWVCWSQKEVIGYVAVTRNGITHIVAGTKPAIVLLSVLGIILFCFLMRVEVRVGEFYIPSLKRRFAAFLFDLWFLLFTMVGISSLTHLLLESQRTGTFQWHFERNYAVASDVVDAAVILFNLSVMVLYFVLPLTKRRRTVGCWIFRLATVSAGGSALYLPLSTALWRTFMEFRGLCSPVRTVKERDTQGRTWYDRETGLMVVGN